MHPPGWRQREGARHVHGTREHLITLDRYGHLMPGNEAEGATMLDAYLDDARSPGAREISSRINRLALLLVPPEAAARRLVRRP